MWSRSVLVVDSDPCVLEALANACRSAGWSVRTAYRCSAALAASSAPPLDTLVVEESLADGSAFALFRRLRELNPELEAVMLTRTPSVPRAVQAIRVGFRDYRCLPVDRAYFQGLFEGAAGESAPSRDDVAPVDRSLAYARWDHIRSVLTEVGGNVSEAARVLGIHRRSLQRTLSRATPPPASPSQQVRAVGVRLAVDGHRLDGGRQRRDG